MPIPLDHCRAPERTSTHAPRRRSLFGKAFRGAGWLAAGPFDWMGTHRITRGASFIRELLVALRTGPRRDSRFKSGDGGAIHLQATAFSYGMPVHVLEARLAARRRQTARIAYATFALAWLFLLTWLWQALSSPWSASRIVLAMDFLPFCALFFLIAFYNALLNFQIRVGRIAGWREYLVTTEPFWPGSGTST